MTKPNTAPPAGVDFTEPAGRLRWRRWRRQPDPLGAATGRDGSAAGHDDADHADHAHHAGRFRWWSRQPRPAPAPVAARIFTRKEASRFLGRATFGPNMAAIDALAASNSDAWFAEQFAKPQTLHRAYIDKLLAAQVGRRSAGSATPAFTSPSGSRRYAAKTSCASAWRLRCRRSSSSRCRMRSVRPLVRGTSSYYRHAGPACFRQLPQPARRRGAASDDGHCTCRTCATRRNRAPARPTKTSPAK